MFSATAVIISVLIIVVSQVKLGRQVALLALLHPSLSDEKLRGDNQQRYLPGRIPHHHCQSTESKQCRVE